jgi:integrase/recombinase XerD
MSYFLRETGKYGEMGTYLFAKVLCKSQDLCGNFCKANSPIYYAVCIYALTGFSVPSLPNTRMTLAFSQTQARAILDKPDPSTLLGVRDRAMLAVGLQVGFRRAEIAGLKVGDFHMNRGFDALKVVRKGGKKGSLAIHPQAAQRIRDYLDVAGHSNDIEGPLFRPVRDNRKGLAARRPLHPDVIDRTLRKYARHIGLDRGYSAHSMRATFITTALDNGASLEEVQSAAGHADPSTTKLYDRRGYNPEKSAGFFANY